MKTITIKFTSQEVAEILEQHINRTLLNSSQRARATFISGNPSAIVEAGQPSLEINCTFTTATEPA